MFSFFDALGALDLSFFWNLDGWMTRILGLPIWWACVLIGLGILVRSIGGSWFAFRFVLAGLYAAFFYLLAPTLAPQYPTIAGWLQSPLYLAGMGLVAALLTPVAIFLLFALLGGWAAGRLFPAYPFAYGFIPGALIAGALALSFRKPIARFVSKVVGSVLIVAALIRFLAIFGLGSFFKAHPVGVWVALLAVVLVETIWRGSRKR